VVRRPGVLWSVDQVGAVAVRRLALEARVTCRRGLKSGWASRSSMAVSRRIGSRLNEEVRVTLEPTRSRINPRVAGGDEGIRGEWGNLCESGRARRQENI